MSDLSAIVTAIEESNTAFADYKATSNAELAALRGQLDASEAKANRRNLNLGAGEGADGVPIAGLPVLSSLAAIKSHYRDKAKSANEEDVSLADFMLGVANMATTPNARKALASGTGTTGGYAVPNLLQSAILEALVPISSLMRAGAGIVPIEAGQTTTFAAVNSIPTAAWRSEAGAVPMSDPSFRAVVATPRSLAFMFLVSRELLADGKGVDGALRNAIAQSFAKELDRAGLRGSGASPEPRGILNTGGIALVSNGANGAMLAGYANIIAATQAILQADAPMPTAAIMSPRSLMRLGGLVDTLGQPIRIPQAIQAMQFIGTSQVPNTLTVGSSTDASEIYVGAFGNMAFAMRENVSIMTADQMYAASGQVAFIGHVRVDVIVKYPAAFSVVTGVR